MNIKKKTTLRNTIRTPPTPGSGLSQHIDKKQTKSPLQSVLGCIIPGNKTIGGVSLGPWDSVISDVTIQPQMGTRSDELLGNYKLDKKRRNIDEPNEDEEDVTERVKYNLRYIEGSSSRTVSNTKLRVGRAFGTVEYDGYYTKEGEQVSDAGTLIFNGYTIEGFGTDRYGEYTCTGTIIDGAVTICRKRTEVTISDKLSLGDWVYAKYRGTDDHHYPGIITGININGMDDMVAISYLDGHLDPLLSARFVVGLTKFTPFANSDQKYKDDTIKLFEKKEKMLRGEVPSLEEENEEEVSAAAEHGTTALSPPDVDATIVEEGTTAVPPPVVDEVMIEEGGEKRVDGSAKAEEDITMMDGEEEEKEMDGHNLGKTGSTSSDDKEPEMKHAVGARVKNEGTDKYGIIEKIVNGKYHIKEDDGTTLIEPMDEDDFGSEYIVVPHSAGTHDNDDADNDNDSGKSGDDMSEDDDTLDNDKSAIEADLNDLQDNGNGEDDEGSEANDDKKKTKNKLLGSIRPASRKKKDSKKEDKEDSKKKGDPSFGLFKSKGVSEQVGKAWEKAKSAIQKKLVAIDEKEKEKYSTDEVKQNATNLMWSSFENDDGMKANVEKERKKFDTARDDAIEPLIEMLMGESERDTLKEYLSKSLKRDLMEDFKNGGKK